MPELIPPKPRPRTENDIRGPLIPAIKPEVKCIACPDPSLLPLSIKDRSARHSAPGNKESPGCIHFYSPSMAKEMNSKQPDVNAAVVLYNLSLWQKNRYKETILDGRRHSFRSLAQLHQDMPYLTKSAIHKALGRIETSLGDEFLIRRDKDTLWYSIGSKTMDKMANGTKCLKKHSFLVADALATKSVRSAVILSNLKHQLDHFTDPVRDEDGSAYGELSPKKLSSILGFSEDTITRSLNDLTQAGMIKRHGQRKCHFTLSQEADECKKLPKIRPAEVHRQPAEVHTAPANVHSRPAEVHSKPLETTLNPLITLGMQSHDKPTCINECINESSNECIKGRISAANASHSCRDSSPSNGLMMLQSTADESLANLRMSKAHNPFDDLSIDQMNDLLPYDFIPHSVQFHCQETQLNVQQMKEFWNIDGIKMDKDDLAKLHRFFHDNPKVDSSDLHGLYHLMLNGPIIIGAESKKPKPRLLTKVKSAKAFLRYLPQIVVLAHQEGAEDLEDVVIDDPWKHIDYSYLGKIPQSKIVHELN